jgi:hypothetical protein
MASRDIVQGHDLALSLVDLGGELSALHLIRIVVNPNQSSEVLGETRTLETMPSVVHEGWRNVLVLTGDLPDLPCEAMLHASRRGKPMISPVSGEVVFSDGLRFSRHEALSASHGRKALSRSPLPIPGWTQHRFGIHPASHGPFEVESDRGNRIHMVMVAHSNPFYGPDTSIDSERRAFHDSVIASDLLGQREFSWGEVFCRLDTTEKKDWLVIAYAAGPQIPLHRAGLLRQLYEREPVRDGRDLRGQ